MTGSNKARTVRRWLMACTVTLAVAAMLAGCVEEKKTGVSYTAYNHTDRGIVDIIVNGQGGVLNAYPRGGGGEVCCVLIPNLWQPGLNVTIKWRGGGEFKRDALGNVVRINGVPVVIEDPWIEKTVEIPAYGAELGRFRIHFFPNDEVKVTVRNYGPGHPDYPFPAPNQSSPTAARATEK